MNDFPCRVCLAEQANGQDGLCPICRERIKRKDKMRFDNCLINHGNSPCNCGGSDNDVFQITHKINEDALTVVELYQKIQNLQAENKRLRDALEHEITYEACGFGECRKCYDCEAELLLKPVSLESEKV